MSLASEGKLKAPKGKYRVVGVDTFEGPTADYPIGDYRTFKRAVAVCLEHGGQMNPCYVYDSNGKCLFKSGSY